MNEQMLLDWMSELFVCHPSCFILSLTLRLARQDSDRVFLKGETWPRQSAAATVLVPQDQHHRVCVENTHLNWRLFFFLLQGLSSRNSLPTPQPRRSSTSSSCSSIPPLDSSSSSAASRWERNNGKRPHPDLSLIRYRHGRMCCSRIIVRCVVARSDYWVRLWDMDNVTWLHVLCPDGAATSSKTKKNRANW